MNDRQISRWREARVNLHQAQQAHRDSALELERAAAELATAGSALAERLRILDATPPKEPTT